MTFEYAESLNQLMALSKQDGRVKKQWQTAISSIPDIEKQLQDDAVLINHFNYIVKQTVLFLDGINQYDQITLKSFLNKFSDTSQKISWFHYELEEILADIPVSFPGIKATMVKNKADVTSTISIDDLTACKSWIEQMRAKKSTLKKIDKKLVELSVATPSSFLGIKDTIDKHKAEMASAIRIEDLSASISWI
ncbi:hypothetical protein, partial [Vibrio cholerae]